MVTPSNAISAVDLAFGPLPRPEHFTNFEHCQECAEHDELLRNRTRETLAFEDVGNPGWDPMCFSTPEGLAFYLPSLARLAFAEPPYGYDWYGHQLLFHLYSGGLENALYTYCKSMQREAVAALIGAMIDSRFSDIESSSSEDEFLRAHEIWSHGRS
ncbi:hypothetical protein KK141_22710 [Dyella sp. LX-66]|uniref:hypothetical protein n=1 Tax=unclassified Dyella TaxID=2634549 RepID=UPI001BE0CB11|nr:MULTISPECIES: hypothetical protein [unclassified Dyella]MBT2118495.1 hypothetical protein [Dyella sp. LX-1]MBT2142375.1 hypothetical protein [Dyella sp. LX-66]